MPNLKDEILKKIDFRTFYSGYLGDLGMPNDQGECQASCPFHPDATPSLSINLTTGLFHCFGCDAKGDIFSFYQKKNKIDFRTAVERMAKDLRINGNGGKGLGELLKTYDYRDAQGNLVFQVCRFEDKQIRLRQPDGHGGWTWSIKGLEAVPYNLREIRKSDTVYVCEGEKDADTLTDLGLVATTNSGGAGNWRKELNTYFKDKNIVILPDNDLPGKKHAEDVAQNLANYARSLKIVNLPDLPPKGDVTDFIKSGNANRQKMRLLLSVKMTPYWEPKAILEPEPMGLTCLEANELLRVEFPAIQEVIGRGILPEGCGLMLSGEAKTGKSLLSLEWAIHLALGTPLFDGLIPIPKKRRVVFFQVENPERQIQFRLSKMLEGLGVSNLPDSIYFADRRFKYNLLDPECVKEMVQVIGRCGADVFIIDPLSSFHLVNENDNVLMRNVLDQITAISVETGAASILIHHFGKPNKDQTEKDRTRGASSIQGWYDGHCTLVNKRHENKTLRTVTFAPLRHGKELKPILIERDDNFLSCVTEVDSMITPKNVQDIINEKFSGRVESAGQLQNALIDGFDCSRRTTIRAIQEAENLGMVKAINGIGKTKIYEVVKS